MLCACTSAPISPLQNLPSGGMDEGVVSIQYLKTLVRDRSTPIQKDLFIEGIVTANDLRGEFYKTIYLTDGTSGIEVEIDRLRLCDIIPMHSRITISCNGLWLGRTGGKITLGAAPQGEYAVDRIPYNDIVRHIRISGILAEPLPVEISLGDLSAALVSQYVCIRGLTVTPEDEGKTWSEPPSDEDSPLAYTDRTFTDEQGRTLVVRTLKRCDYRHEVIPSQPLMLMGEADYAGGIYLLRIVNHRIYPMQ